MRSHLEVDATCHRFKGHGTRHWLGCRYCYCIKLDCRLCTRGEGAACTPLSSPMRCDSSWLSRDSRVARDDQTKTKRFLFSETFTSHEHIRILYLYFISLPPPSVLFSSLSFAFAPSRSFYSSLLPFFYFFFFWLLLCIYTHMYI